MNGLGDLPLDASEIAVSLTLPENNAKIMEKIGALALVIAHQTCSHSITRARIGGDSGPMLCP